MAPEFDDMEAIADPQRWVHMNMTEDMRRYRYHELRTIGFTSHVARRVRDWHTREYESLLSISPIALAKSEILPGVVPAS